MSQLRSAPKSSVPLVALSPLSIARTLWKHKLLLVLIWGALTAATIIIVRQMPPLYTAEALILVDSQKIPEKFVSSTVSTRLQDRIATISQQILSSARLKKIIEDFDLYHDYRKTHFEEEVLEQMRQDIGINVEQGWTGSQPGAFRVRYQASNPTVVAQVANRIANLFIEENLKTREQEAAGTSQFMDTQLQEAKKKLDELEAAVSRYKVEHNGELPEQQNILAGTLSRLQVELESNRDGMNRAQDQKVVLDNTLTALESNIALMTRPTNPPQAGAPAAVTAAPPERKRSEILQLELDDLRAKYREDHPDVRRVKALLAQAKREEDAAEARAPRPPAPPSADPGIAGQRPPVRPAVTQSPEYRQATERLSTLRSQIALLDRELSDGKANEQRILKDISAYQARLNRLPIREQEMAQVTRDYEVSKANYKSLLDKKLAAEMATDMEHRAQSERFTLLDPARVPERPTKPNRPLLRGVGVVLGLVIALAVSMGTELRKNVLLGEWELPAGTTVLGTLPRIDLDSSRDGSSTRPTRSRKRIWLWRWPALVSIVSLAAAGLYFWSRGF